MVVDESKIIKISLVHGYPKVYAKSDNKELSLDEDRVEGYY